MSTALQLLAQYYEAVIESDRIYHEHISSNLTTGADVNDEAQQDSILMKETISLQRQVTQLIAECNLLKQENEKHKQLHKTQIALMESKLENAKKRATKPKSTSPKDGPINTHKVQLLSPISKDKLQGKEIVDSQGVSKIAGALEMAAKQNEGLRHAINKNMPTLFDDDTNDFAENSHEHSNGNSFSHTVREKGKLNKVVLPRDNLPHSSSDTEEPKHSHDRASINEAEGFPKAKQKKRRLIKKRVQTVETDSENP
ncbi:LADA_0G08504g1_1 [Lachancea dasiensis]|uniref:LADA_0G08504g1_1 n=1 Tax=Lachancea dasiensis TaxID=1072105 RepID=A0A1G4JU86_9SACH|nr:LADA_0G08504g1_1 [Lachancea dasiensis]